MTKMRPLLLDTNAAIWIARNESIARRAEEAINAAHQASTAIFISAITAWEVGLLVSRNRLNLLMTPERLWKRGRRTQTARAASESGLDTQQ